MFVYAIGKKEDLVEPYENCYIGVSSDPISRWKKHVNSKYEVGHYIRENSLSFSENMKIIFEGCSEECFDLEIKYRPSWNIGLNIAPGGKGGKVLSSYDSSFCYIDEQYQKRYNDSRNKAISKALKGKRKSEDHKESISKSKKNSGSSAGKNNAMSKQWLLTSPRGIVYSIHGNLVEICENNMILVSALRRYKGSEVPPPNYSGFGGYRPKSEESKIMRENTTGWKLEELKNAYTR